ncbi:Transcription factor Sox-8 [Halocaridina rubra]|uniref:Transcription factor Sox-8 n=1 Tax=Halocaridina rubra TaxID=373956 RepID=A0AAN8WU76_HALRR
MEEVKIERVSPVMGETASYEPETPPRSGGVANQKSTDIKPVGAIKSYIPANYASPSSNANSSCPITNHATVISTTASSNAAVIGDLSNTRAASLTNRTTIVNGGLTLRNSVGETTLENVLLAAGNHHNANFSGDISEAVSKILDDYDWSKIPMANKDAAARERRKLHVKRPMNAFMVWAQEARRKLSCSHRQVHNAELSKSLGRIWRGMTEDQKRPFIERADQLRKKHKQEYPDYKYQPRRRKENVKTVSKCPQGGQVNMQDIAHNPHYTSSSVKGGNLGLSIHPLSPPNSPSNQVVKCHTETHLGDSAGFVPDCLTDTFENIDRAEMNKYLLPDQGAASHYVVATNHAGSGGLQPMTTMSSLSSMNTMSVPNSSNVCSSSLSTGSSSTLTTLPSIAPRLLPPGPPLYGGSSSPYYAGGASPHPGGQGSPELIVGDISANSTGGVSPGGSPGSPQGEYVDLQPRVPKEEPLPPLSSPKPSNVNPFLHQNLCYSPQPYATFQYSYPYATMWH